MQRRDALLAEAAGVQGIITDIDGWLVGMTDEEDVEAAGYFGDFLQGLGGMGGAALGSYFGDADLGRSLGRAVGGMGGEFLQNRQTVPKRLPAVESYRARTAGKQGYGKVVRKATSRR